MPWTTMVLYLGTMWHMCLLWQVMVSQWSVPVTQWSVMAIDHPGYVTPASPGHRVMTLDLG